MCAQEVGILLDDLGEMASLFFLKVAKPMLFIFIYL